MRVKSVAFAIPKRFTPTPASVVLLIRQDGDRDTHLTTTHEFPLYINLCYQNEFFNLHCQCAYVARAADRSVSRTGAAIRAAAPSSGRHVGTANQCNIVFPADRWNRLYNTPILRLCRNYWDNKPTPNTSTTTSRAHRATTSITVRQS